MSKEEAVYIIYKIINSGIIDIELEDQLKKITLCIEREEWEE